MRFRYAVALLCLPCVACGLVLSVDQYRDCANASECAPDGAAADAQGDAQADAPPDAPLVACKKSSDCSLPTPVCSQGLCASVQTLVRGTVSYQCAILSDQTLWCWGINDHGQLGRGAVGGTEVVPAPASGSVVPKGALVLQVGVANGFGCALTDDKKVRCWGDGTGGSGAGTSTIVSLPADAIELGAGSSGACARLVDKSVYCWGENGYGALGCAPDAGSVAIATSSPRLLLDGKEDIAQLAIGGYANCALKSNGDVLCFGNTAWGNLGDGRSGPDQGCQTSKLTGFASNRVEHLETADFATCAKDINAQFYCWGVNDVYFNAGLLWPPQAVPTFTTPFHLPVPSGTRSVSIGWLHSCGLELNGNVSCWGQSNKGETGTIGGGPISSRSIAGLSDVREIASHRQFTCARQGDGQIMCWGDNEFGELGSVGPTTATPRPVSWP
jgi:hypothetical protein